MAITTIPSTGVYGADIAAPINTNFSEIDEKIKVMIFTMPLTGVVDTRLNWIGNDTVITTGETGDYSTDFGAVNQHICIKINTITTGGDIVITGTKVHESTMIPTAATETITVDTSTDQRYQTNLKWLEITNIDVSDLDTPDYDVELCGYLDFGNSAWTVVGYRADIKTSSNTSDFALQLVKVQDDGSKKMSYVPMEDYGHDSLSNGGKYFDNLRTGGDDRGFTMTGSVPLADNNDNMCYKALDFNSYFTSDENVLDGTLNEGLLIHLEGRTATGTASGISAIDHICLSLYYTKEA